MEPEGSLSRSQESANFAIIMKVITKVIRFHAPTTLPKRKKFLVPIQYNAGSASEPVAKINANQGLSNR
jgi:hypothetical protein